jgi:hypothetical protein
MSNFPIIGICGPAKSGKDLVADWFNTKGLIKAPFSYPMKRFVQDVFACDTNQLWGPSELRETPFNYSDEKWFGVMERAMKTMPSFLEEVTQQGERVTAYLSLCEWLGRMLEQNRAIDGLSLRYVLQTLGTEWGRKKVNPLIWINYLYNKTLPRLKSYPVYSGVVIPDHRFLNEIQATQAHGGYCIKLRRLAIQKESAISNVGIDGHQSEVEMRDIPDSEFDLILELPEGINNVYTILEQIFEDKAWTLKRKATLDIALSEKESPSNIV